MNEFDIQEFSAPGILIPTQLFVGNQDILIEETEKILQSNFCKNKDKPQEQGVCFCSGCKKIKANQHESIVWIDPEKNYTIKDIDIIFEKVNYVLDEDQKFFFILQKAQNFNLACANKLLKVLEEPPVGYNFILHTNNLNSILPTIVSRCYIKSFTAKSGIELGLDQHPLLSFFYNKKLDLPVEFEKELKSLHLSDSQSIELLSDMISFYGHKIVDSYRDGDDSGDYETVFDFLKDKMKMLPQSGSSNVFWKNLYMGFPG